MSDKSASKRTGYTLIQKLDFMVLVDSIWYPCNDVNIDLDPSQSAIAVALEDKRFADGHGIPPQEIKHFTVRQFYVDPSMPQKCYTRLGIEKLIRDLAERMKPEPGMPAAQQKAIWDGVTKFEGLYQGEPQAA